jgi:hypothetical protein
MDELRDISNFLALENKLHGWHYNEFNGWLKTIRLLHNQKNCDSCGETMTQKKLLEGLHVRGFGDATIEDVLPDFSGGKL